ncbi:MAG: hypothetical protein ABIF17_01935 [Patescibacteria group bacterium]
MPNLDLSKNKNTLAGKKTEIFSAPKNKNIEIEELKKLIVEQNLLLQKIYENSSRTKKYIFFGRLISIFYLIMVLVPIIFAIIYLPPFIESNLKPYQELLQNSGVNNSGSLLDYIKKINGNSGVNLEDLIQSYK